MDIVVAVSVPVPDSTPEIHAHTVDPVLVIVTRTGEETQSEIEIDVDCSRAVDNPAVAERVVTQVTVRVGPVELRCWRKFGCGVAASSCIVGWTRSLGARTMGYVAVRLAILLRTGLWTVVVRLVVRTVIDIAAVRTVIVRAVGYIAVVWTVVVRAVGYIAVIRLLSLLRVSIPL